MAPIRLTGTRTRVRTAWRAAALGAALALVSGPDAAAGPLEVAATVPDLGSLVREVGGDEVEVTVFAKSTEDPHFVEPKPSFVKALSRADFLVTIGLDLERGWLPTLLAGARNAAVMPGSPGHLDASIAVEPLEVPTGTVDRSMGDLHPAGNPHYLLDPLSGLAVAARLRDRLATLRPQARAAFEARYADFRRRLAERLVGTALASAYDAEKLAALDRYGRLDAFLRAQGRAADLGGWLGAMRPYRGSKAVDDHNVWPYFARRFGLVLVAHMEPTPGIPPTTRHLGRLVETMQAERVRLILASAYYDPRHARFLAERTGARIASLAHQVGARAGSEDYLAMSDLNVRQVVAALGDGAGGAP